MSESDFQTYKAEFFETINNRERDRNGCVWITTEDGKDIDVLARVMRELNEEGHFQEYHAYISPPKWAVRMSVAARTEVQPAHNHNYFGKVHMGDVFQGISNATIISRSKVEGAFNRLQDSGQSESAKLLVEIGNHVSDANNVAAGAVYSQMTEELSKPAHDKGVLKSCWDGLVAILPPLASLSTEVIKAFAT